MKPIHYKIINNKKRFLVHTADTLLNTAAYLRLLPSRSQTTDLRNESIQRILIIRLAYVGDVVMTLPVIKPLAKAFPGARIDFLTSRFAAPLLESCPNLSSIISFNAPWFYRGPEADNTKELVSKLKDERYDLGIDFRGDIRNIYHCLYRPQIRYRVSYNSGGGDKLLTHAVHWKELKHKVEYHLDILKSIGIAAKSTCPEICLTDDEVQIARDFLNRLPGCRERSPLVIHPGARMPLKKWSIEKFVDLVKRIDKCGLGPVLVIDTKGSEYARQMADNSTAAINLAGALSLREMAALLSLCCMMVCHDSGPMHIAAAVNTPVIALFGPSRPIETAPCGTDHTVLEGQCNQKDTCDENNCLTGRSECMQKITVEKVLNEIQNRML